jgi:SAM-dependent methyltransferase
MSRHLDIGCGHTPRNPYARDELFGVDLAGAAADTGPIRRANLVMQPIPFADSHFDSVSAYDFLEHVPRVLPTADGQGTRFPFIELMNEVWRVLAPGGLFYAVTPAYPSKAAFQDPTHVNIITAGTHTYFTQPQRQAAMYGFGGDFVLRREPHWAKTRAGQAYVPVPQGLPGRWRAAHRAWRASRGATAHLVWEFEAVKP